MPPRKRQRPNPTLLSSLSLPTTALSPETSLSRASSTSAQQASDQKKPPQPESNSERKSSDASQRVKEVKTPVHPSAREPLDERVLTGPQIRKTNSWYASWSKPPKATASTSVARENILGGTVRTRNAPDFSRFEAKRSEDDASMPDDADPCSLFTYRGQEALGYRAPTGDTLSSRDKATPEQQQKASDNTKAQEQRPELEAPADKDDQTHDASQKQVPSAGWFGGWWAKPAPVEPAAKPIPGSQETKEEAMKPAETIEPAEAAPPRSKHLLLSLRQPRRLQKLHKQPLGLAIGPNAKTAVPPSETALPKDERQNGSAVTVSRASSKKSKINLNEDPKAKAGDVPTPDVSQPEPVAAQSTPPKAGSTWAFWVANLWKLLLNWIEHIRQADLVVIACHSQGVPVSIMLLEKLIDLGVLTDTKIGVCAMAGVALGPFPDYKSSILMGSAAELWEFGDPQSNNSQRFEACLKRVVDFGARITFVGSIDDQLVPMESAVYSPANHPYIYRAVFIDGRVHAPDFISHLIGFALKLRNLGISDHGLIRELSVALAGSLYSGEGHSRLYFDSAVYDLAITHALETTNTAQPTPCLIPKRDTTPLASSNPYVLPWIMRGLLEEDFVKTQLSAETEELLRQFDDWKPTNKALKDVKYRLEAVRSKL
ncbi:hypothetical protein TrVFT333_007191 [Trichoderma virens FT-333]|nr:hypothetical protein TrVFT333_007191 [Trichoderma virens FT-333]